MCFSPPKAPSISLPKIPEAVAPPTQLDAEAMARAKRRQTLKGDRTSLDTTGGLGDPSLAPVTKTSLGG